MAQAIIHRESGDLTVNLLNTKNRIIDYVVKEDLSIDVRVPIGMEETLVEKYIKKYEQEIIDSYERIRQEKQQALPVTCNTEEGRNQYDSGSTLPFLGKTNLILRVKRRFSGSGTRIFPQKGAKGEQYLVIETDNPSQDFIRYCIICYYKKCAEALISKRLKVYATAMKLQYDDVQITNRSLEPKFHYSRLAHSNLEINNQTTVWGSCTRKKQLRFDWKLVMLPMEVIDYILVHELTHLKKMNHSPAFWKQIEKIMPNYQDHREWLDQHGKEYEIF